MESDLQQSQPYTNTCSVETRNNCFTLEKALLAFIEEIGG